MFNKPNSTVATMGIDIGQIRPSRRCRHDGWSAPSCGRAVAAQ